MSVSRSPDGSRVPRSPGGTRVPRSPGRSRNVADPNDVHLNTSRLSHMSNASTGKTLQGLNYHCSNLLCFKAILQTLQVFNNNLDVRIFFIILFIYFNLYLKCLLKIIIVTIFKILKQICHL